MSEQGFDEWARASTPRLYRSAWLLCGDRHQAEDLVQETLAKIYVRWSSPLRGRIDSPTAYAHTTLTRTFISARRRRSSTEKPYADVPDLALTGDAETSDLRLTLVAALAGLAKPDRAVLVLRYLEDLSVEEVADRMGVTPGAVRSRSMRALARVRPLLDDSLAVTPEKGTTHE